MRSLHSPVLLVAVLAGLFALYGLKLHHEDHTAGHLPSIVALVAADDAHAQGHDGTETGQTTGPPHTTSSDSAPNDDGGPGLGECLALLGLLAWTAFCAGLAARPTRPLANLRTVPAQHPLLRRPPDPPCLHRLSTLRC